MRWWSFQVPQLSQLLYQSRIYGRLSRSALSQLFFESAVLIAQVLDRGAHCLHFAWAFLRQVVLFEPVGIDGEEVFRCAVVGLIVVGQSIQLHPGQELCGNLYVMTLEMKAVKVH